MDVSIVIVNWNTCNILRDCLRSVYEQTHNLNFEVIVIDNASSDSSVEMLKDEFSQVRLIEDRKNRGFAAANNQGIAVSKGRYVLLLNSDTIVLNSAISKTVYFADEHKDAAVVGCRVLNRDCTLQPTCFMFPSVLNILLSFSYLYKLFAGSRFFGRELMTWWGRDEVREVDVVTGCFMLVRQRAIEEVGFMDEQFFMYAEETDWCYRFNQAGWKVMFTPIGEIIHLGGQSSQRVRGEMLIQLRLSILQFIKKHGTLLSYLTACVLTILFFVLRVPIWLIIGAFDERLKKEAAVKIRAYIRGIGQVLFTSIGLSVRKKQI